MNHEKTLSEPLLPDCVRSFQAAKNNRDRLKQAGEDRGEEFRFAEEQITHSYRAIRRSLEQKLAAKAKQSGIKEAIFDDIFETVLSKCIERVDPDGGNLLGYFSRTLNNEVANYFRENDNRKPLPWIVQSDDTDSEAGKRSHTSEQLNEPTSDTSDQPSDDAILKEHDPEAFRQVRLQRLREEYAGHKRSLINELKFDSASRLATLLTDQRQRMAKLLDNSSHKRDEVTSLTEFCERWTAQDLQRDIETGVCKTSMVPSRSLSAVWSVINTRFQDPHQSIDQKLVADAISNCGARMSHAAWRQRVRRYLDEMQRQLNPDDLKYFLS